MSPKKKTLKTQELTSNHAQELFLINKKLCTEIAERKQAELRLFTQYSIARILGNSTSLFQATPAILEAICKNLEWILGELWYVERTSNLLRYIAGWYSSELNAEELETTTRQYAFPIGAGLPGYIWEKKKPIWVSDISKKKHFSHSTVVSEQGLQAAVGFPILLGEGVLGVMLFFSPNVKPLDRNLLHMMATIGGHIGQFIERKQAEENQAQLQASIQKSALEWQETFDIIDSLVLILGVDGEIKKLNWAARQLCGKSYKKLIGQSIFNIALGQPWQRIAELVRKLSEHHTQTSHLIQDISQDKSWSISAFFLNQSELEDQRIIVVARDITKVIELEEALRRNETMAAMGTLIAGVAHEVRNPLFSMTATMDAFEKEFNERQEYKDYFRVLRNSLNRLTNLMKELLEYGKPANYEFANNSLSEILTQSILSCQSLAEELKVEIKDSFIGKIFPPVFCDRMRLLQVFQNILENAIQHSPAYKTVSIDVNLVITNNQNWLECLIKDLGPGFLENDIAKVFDPFFTRRLGGIGLGLSIVERIVEKHRGKVTILNHKEGGAMVIVRLPIPQN
ncbi:MAG: GAF domain-containing protein [Acidobacteria bacterium]|nr:GAF domain-containing protein [Acidobacteriota bacterium]